VRRGTLPNVGRHSEGEPNLLIDNCASGGRRVDLEAVSRALVLWRSDNTCDMLDHNPNTVAAAAFKNQLMSAGLNRYLPFSTVGQMGATPYLFRSGFNGGISFGEDIRGKDYPRELLKQGIAKGRGFGSISTGNFYPLSEATRILATVSHAVSPTRGAGWYRHRVPSRSVTVRQLRLQPARDRSIGQLSSQRVSRL